MLSDILTRAGELTNVTYTSSATDPNRQKILRWVNRAARELWKIWLFPNATYEAFMCFDTIVSHDYVTPWYMDRVMGVRQSTTGARITLQNTAPRYAPTPWRQPYNVWRNTGKRCWQASPQMNSQVTVVAKAVETQTVNVSITGPTATGNSVTEILTFPPGTQMLTTTNQFIFTDAIALTAINKDQITNGDFSIQTFGQTGLMEIALLTNRQYDVWYQLWAIADDKTLNVWVDNCFEVYYRNVYTPLYFDTDVFADGSYDDVVAWQVQIDFMSMGQVSPADVQSIAALKKLQLDRLANLTKADEVGLDMFIQKDPDKYFNAQKTHGKRRTHAIRLPSV